VEDEDFEEILKEIEIMKQCESAYIVTYYGSFWRREENEMWVREANCKI
jgi:sugar phosphate isomerase/epimerase